ncbi:MAG: type I-U CRISPR-associated protein Csx17 [Leptolyngbya sp. Prado105]|nr:type I-U CRISPR-associated protein Csx17 [Leptolyngbya sp. Prado105]
MLNLARQITPKSNPETFEYDLPGISPQPLGSYLAGLGILRLLNRTIDPNAEAVWHGSKFRLKTIIPAHELTDQLIPAYTALHIISPWNKDAKITVTEGIAQFIEDSWGHIILTSPSPRVAGLRSLFQEVLTIVGEFPNTDKDAKQAQIAALRGRIFDPEWTEWCSATVIVCQEIDNKGKSKTVLKYPALLGTGGNIGATDIAGNYVNALSEVFDLTTSESAATSSAQAMFNTALFGTIEAAKTVSEAVKAIHLFPANDFFLDHKRSESRDYVESGGSGGSAINPVAILLATEGLLTFSHTISTINVVLTDEGTKFKASQDIAKYSLAVSARGSSNNLVSLSERQSWTEDLFLPLWQTPLTHTNLKSRLFQSPLCTEEQFFLRRRIHDGTDFVQAVSEWAKDNHITGKLIRYTLLPRKGQANFAICLGVINVGTDTDHDLAADLNELRHRLIRAASDAPATLANQIYAFDRTYSEFCAGRCERHSLLFTLAEISRHPSMFHLFTQLELRQEWIAGYEHLCEFRLALGLGLQAELHPSNPIGSMVEILRMWGQLDLKPSNRTCVPLADITAFINGTIDLARFTQWVQVLRLIKRDHDPFPDQPRSTAKLPHEYRLALLYIDRFGYANVTHILHVMSRLMGVGIHSRSPIFSPTQLCDRVAAALLFPVSQSDKQEILRRHFRTILSV